MGKPKATSSKVGDPSIYNRLYGQYKDLIDKRKQVGSMTSAQRKEEEDMKECSFKPVTHSKGQGPRDQNKFLEEQNKYLQKVEEQRKKRSE